MEKYVIAHDLGTSGNKATLYSLDGKLIKSALYSYPLYVSAAGTAEQDADDWWRAVAESTKELLDGIAPSEIAAVSFSGQMMGCLCVDKDGKPLRRSLIWADMRSTKEANEIARNLSKEEFYRIIGHRLSPSYSATKLMWVKNNEREVYDKTYRMLHAKDYVIFRLTGVFATEPSDASSTCLMDLSTLTWSDTVIRAAGLSKEMLPEIIPSTAIAGRVTKEAAAMTGLLEGTPVVMGGGDGSCAAVGCGVVREGSANLCLGTSSWISVAAKTPIFDPEMKTFTFAHVVPGYYIPTGTMQTGGGALSWAVKTLYGAPEGQEAFAAADIYRSVAKEVAKSPLGAKGLYFLPYLMGERSPRWNDRAKGSFVGLTMAHERGDMLRAVMEGVGYNLGIILETLRKNGCQIDSLISVGGGARNQIFIDILADLFGIVRVVGERLRVGDHDVGFVECAGVLQLHAA
ncbi:MAG: FGGY-family carbohydrate kinase, partial [Clostridia bacterium]|nr:FGGY-family carbohydrate kinase [Clostridia bacterium]